ncbi:MAG TPA: hypothetical protein VK166_05095 [Chitinophagaceae bacterium]|nr:hypothetical protein [Chitinophagaceae bacterium]
MILFIFSTTTSFGQLDKGVWIIGGSGSFSVQNRDFVTPAYTVIYKDVDITISPSIGYFVIDKLALGFRPSYLLKKSEDRGSTGTASGGRGNFSSFEIGAFGRWYFLKKDNNYNIVSDISYNYGFQSNFGSNTGHNNSFKFLTGPVIYFNSSVGIELLLGYSRSKVLNNNNTSALNRGFLTTIGFQIHLGKNK